MHLQSSPIEDSLNLAPFLHKSWELKKKSLELAGKNYLLKITRLAISLLFSL
jgi:hypothetical protein